LGHASLKSTEIHLRADPDENLETLMAVAPLIIIKKGKFKAPDKPLTMLQEKNNY
jgi:hypothetical protein